MQFCYHQRKFLEKLIEAVEVLANASFCSGEGKGLKEMDVVDYGVNREETVRLDGKDLKEHQVNFENSQNSESTKYSISSTHKHLSSNFGQILNNLLDLCPNMYG